MKVRAFKAYDEDFVASVVLANKADMTEGELELAEETLLSFVYTFNSCLLSGDLESLKDLLDIYGEDRMTVLKADLIARKVITGEDES